MAYGSSPTNISENVSQLLLASIHAHGGAEPDAVAHAAPREPRRPHAALLHEDLLEQTRTAFATVISIMNHRSDSMADAYVRHHLVAMTREVADIGRSLLERAAVAPRTLTLAGALDHEVAYLSRPFPHRIRRASDVGLSPKSFPPWTLVQVFRLLVHDLLADIIRNTSHGTELQAFLQKTGDVLRLEIKCMSLQREPHLVTHLKSRLRVRQRLEALDGRLVAGRHGLSICFPAAVFAEPCSPASSPEGRIS